MKHIHEGITHSNGVIECYSCGKLIVPKKYMRLYKGAAYKGKVLSMESERKKGHFRNPCTKKKRNPHYEAEVFSDGSGHYFSKVHAWEYPPKGFKPFAYTWIHLPDNKMGTSVVHLQRERDLQPILEYWNNQQPQKWRFVAMDGMTNPPSRDWEVTEWKAQPGYPPKRPDPEWWPVGTYRFVKATMDDVGFVEVYIDPNGDTHLASSWDGHGHPEFEYMHEKYPKWIIPVGTAQRSNPPRFSDRDLQIMRHYLQLLDEHPAKAHQFYMGHEAAIDRVREYARDEISQKHSYDPTRMSEIRRVRPLDFDRNPRFTRIQKIEAYYNARGIPNTSVAGYHFTVTPVGIDPDHSWKVSAYDKKGVPVESMASYHSTKQEAIDAMYGTAHQVAQFHTPKKNPMVGNTKVSVYDNGGRTADRYTVLIHDPRTGDVDIYGMSDDALMPNGFNQYVGSKTKGEPLSSPVYGKRVNNLSKLPQQVRMAIERRVSSMSNPRRSNPAPRGAVKIYDNIEAIEAIKGDDSLWPKQPFRHDFKPGSEIYGMPDGSIMIKSKKGQKLWKNFNYPEKKRRR